MPPYAGSVRVTGYIAPTDTGDTYACYDDEFNRGGYRVVADNAARTGITADRRKEGMMVFQVDTLHYWQLQGGIANANWVDLGLWPVTSGGLPPVIFTEAEENTQFSTLLDVPAGDAAGTSQRTGRGKSIVRTPDGYLHAVFQATNTAFQQIFYVYSTDRGVSWSVPVRIDTGVDDKQRPCIAYDSDLKLHVAYCGPGANAVYYKGKPLGGAWTAQTIINVTAASEVYIAVSQDDTVVVSWDKGIGGMYNNTLYYNFSSNGGTTWSGENTITTGGAHNLYGPYICGDHSANLIHCVYQVLLGVNDTEIWYGQYDVGADTWSVADTGVAHDDNNTACIEVGLDPEHLAIVYTLDTNSLEVIRSGDEGATWDAPITASFFGGIGAEHPQVLPYGPYGGARTGYIVTCTVSDGVSNKIFHGIMSVSGSNLQTEWVNTKNYFEPSLVKCYPGIHNGGDYPVGVFYYCNEDDKAEYTGFKMTWGDTPQFGWESEGQFSILEYTGDTVMLRPTLWPNASGYRVYMRCRPKTTGHIYVQFYYTIGHLNFNTYFDLGNLTGGTLYTIEFTNAHLNYVGFDLIAGGIQLCTDLTGIPLKVYEVDIEPWIPV